MKNYDFLIVGAGIYGVTAAISLCKRNYRVGILNPDYIPHPLAASTDISKVVRMEYGADQEYMDMVEEAFVGWREWNTFFKQTLYHEIGFLMLCNQPVSMGKNSFELSSFDYLKKRGYHPEQLDAKTLKSKFPAFAPEAFPESFFNPVGGFAESGRVVEVLAKYAKQLGVDIYTNQTAQSFEQEGGKLIAVKTEEGSRFAAGHVVVCAGAYTPHLLPDLLPSMQVTGHPVFHLKPRQPEWFSPPRFSVFTADISNTGWYGFPLHPREGVVKIANHGIGVEIHPAQDERVVSPMDEQNLRQFLSKHIPMLADDPVVYTRRCLYNDTLDGHFWIDQHPGIDGLTVAAGGSGHAFKMAPVLGDMIAATAIGDTHKWSRRHRWRTFEGEIKQEEEARFKPQ